MKRLVIGLAIASAALALAAPLCAQPTPGPLPAAPKGFDKKRENIARGKVETIEYDSKSVGGKRKMVIYTAPGLDAQAKVPVLYLLHGAGDDETGWQKKGSADVILDNLYADKKLAPMIVVMPNGFAGKGGKGKGGGKGGGGDAFENDLLKDVIPYVESHYPVKTDRESRGIAGLSMGGGQALRIGLKNLDQFAWVGGFSSALFGNAGLIKDGPDATKKLRLLWVSCGDKDSLLKGSESFHTSLENLKVPHVWHLEPGGHTWPVWKNDLYLMSQLLFQVKAAPAPTKLEPAPKGFDAREKIARGKIETVEYDSKTVGAKRKMVIYTPPGFSKDATYPVFYLLHGAGDDETGWQKKGSADVILDNLYADKKLMPMIVVMPNGFAQGPKGKNAGFEDDLLKDIIPYVESHYPVLKGRENRALAGLSMGAGQSLRIGLKHLDTFAWVGGFSGGGGGAASLVPDADLARKQLRLLWISCGDADKAFKPLEAFHVNLEERKIPHVWHVDSGGHTWPVWKNDLYLISQLLFRDKK